MDSIKFRSVHLMDDGDGHHNFGIDGDGDAIILKVMVIMSVWHHFHN